MLRWWYRSLADREGTKLAESRNREVRLRFFFFEQLEAVCGNKENPMAKGQSLQDPFLNALRKERVPVSIYLVNGIKLQGQIDSFDNSLFC